MASFFSMLFPRGTQMATCTRSICPAQANPAPWLPRVAPTTPRFFSSSERAVSAASALRALNDWVGWWFSCLTSTLMLYPTASSTGGYRRSGVTRRRSRMRFRACSTSAMVMGHIPRHCTPLRRLPQCRGRRAVYLWGCLLARRGGSEHVVSAVRLRIAGEFAPSLQTESNPAEAGLAPAQPDRASGWVSCDRFVEVSKTIKRAVDRTPCGIARMGWWRSTHKAATPLLASPERLKVQLRMFKRRVVRTAGKRGGELELRFHGPRRAKSRRNSQPIAFAGHDVDAPRRSPRTTWVAERCPRASRRAGARCAAA